MVSTPSLKLLRPFSVPVNLEGNAVFFSQVCSAVYPTWWDLQVRNLIGRSWRASKHYYYIHMSHSKSSLSPIP